LENDLQTLRIDKSARARRDEKPLWPWALAALLVIGAGLVAWRWIASPSAVAVKTVIVKLPEGGVVESDLVKLNATGYVMASHKIELATKVVGRVAWVGVEMGDKIEKDQVLVRLEDDEYLARVAEMQGQLDSAKAKLAELEAGSRQEEIAKARADLDAAVAAAANAQANADRLRGMSETAGQIVSRQELADAETLVLTRAAEMRSLEQAFEMARQGPRREQIDAQRATVRQLEGSLALSMVELKNTIIRSTIKGTVLERNVEVGEFVTTGFVGDRGAKGYVVSIADLSDLRIELDISQNDFAKIAPQQPCWITTDAYPDRRYDGTVDLIAPEANRQKATVEVRVKVLNPDALLKPDMNATVSFLSPQKLADAGAAATRPAAERPAIRVPSGAVRDGAAWIVEGGKAVSRAVASGAAIDGQVEIRKGLSGGEELIVDPPAALKEGDTVVAQR
jgi:HlyD family secretion protein